MALTLGKSIFGQDVLKKRGGIVRTDLFKFGEISFITDEGPPAGTWPEGMLFFNGADRRLFNSINLKRSNTPTLGWYKCNQLTDNILTDFSGNQRNGAVTSATTVTGNYGSAVFFDGTDDKVELPASLDMTFNLDWTISFWVKLPATFADTEKVYVLERFKDGNEYFLIYIEGEALGEGTIKIVHNNGGGAVTEQISFKEIPKDTWVFVHLTHDTSRNLIFARTGIDDWDIEAASLPVINFVGTETFTIGHSQLDASFGDNSYAIDDLKIWDSDRKAFDGTPPSTFNVEYDIDILNIDIQHWIYWDGLVYPHNDNLS